MNTKDKKFNSKVIHSGHGADETTGAVKLAKSLGNGKKIVTILCDDANKYYDKMFNKEYLISKNLPYADWM